MICVKINCESDEIYVSPLTLLLNFLSSFTPWVCQSCSWMIHLPGVMFLVYDFGEHHISTIYTCNRTSKGDWKNWCSIRSLLYQTKHAKISNRKFRAWHFLSSFHLLCFPHSTRDKCQREKHALPYKYWYLLIHSSLSRQSEEIPM